MDHLLLEPNGDAFDRAVNRLIADGDDRELLDRLGELPSIVERLRSQPDDRFDVWIPVLTMPAPPLRSRYGAASAASSTQRSMP